MPALVGRVALITGASSGIGEATARALAHEGVSVGLLARREERLNAVAEAIRRSGGHALVCPADVTDASTVHEAVQRLLGEWGRIDLLVNNAGRGMAAPFQTTTVEELRTLLDVNLIGVFTATRAVLPGMLKAGSGHVINVSSIVGRRGIPFRAAYSASKFALVGLTESLRVELKETGIHVSLVYPIYTQTEFHDVGVQRAAPIHRGPVQSAEQVARAIVRCARHPRPEVYPFQPARILAALSPVAPGFVDWMIHRLSRR